METEKLVDKSIVLTDEVVDDLLEDWLERDGDTFVKVHTKGRLGWEDSLEEDSAYSEYFATFTSVEEAVKKAYSMATDVVKVMQPPFKVKVKVTKKDTSCTDSKMMFVSTSMFDDTEIALGRRVDIFLGTAIHETCHLCYTNWEDFPDKFVPLEKTIANILEDERIEEKCCEDFPGYHHFIEAVKDYYFDKMYLDAYTARKGTLTPLDEIMDIILKVVRYPKYLEEADILKWGHYLIAIKKVLLPYPTSTKGVWLAAYDIYQIIKEFYHEKMSDESKEKESEAASELGGEGAGDAVGDMVVDTALKGEAITDSMVEAALSEDAKRSLVKEFEDKREITSHSEGFKISEKGELLGDVCEGTAEIGSSSGVVVNKVKSNAEKYKKAYSEIVRYIPAVSKILRGNCRDYKLIHKSMRSGVLDTSKLAEAYQGVPTVYMREGRVKTDRISVCVLIDESGSMFLSGDDGKKTRIDAARETAVLLNEALGRLPNVDLFIYGHSGDIRWSGETSLYVYRERNDYDRYALGAVSAKSENRDGIAVLEAAKRVRKQTEERVLMFVISDGSPAAYGYSGSAAIGHTKECVHKAEQMGFDIIQICMYKPHSDVSAMFRHHIILEDMSTFALRLGTVIKKAVLGNTKIRVS